MSMLPRVPGGATFVPNHLIDQAMPTLKDTEWRVLLVVCRQTLGRTGSAGERRQSDWLTQAQLKRRTGRASEAVSHAIDRLVRRNLLEVVDETGSLLLSAAARRSHAGRLYFRLTARALGKVARPNSTSSKIEHRKANTTKESKYIKNIYGSRKLNVARRTAGQFAGGGHDSRARLEICRSPKSDRIEVAFSMSEYPTADPACPPKPTGKWISAAEVLGYAAGGGRAGTSDQADRNF